MTTSRLAVCLGGASRRGGGGLCPTPCLSVKSPGTHRDGWGPALGMAPISAEIALAVFPCSSWLPPESPSAQPSFPQRPFPIPGAFHSPSSDMPTWVPLPQPPSQSRQGPSTFLRRHSPLNPRLGQSEEAAQALEHRLFLHARHATEVATVHGELVPEQPQMRGESHCGLTEKVLDDCRELRLARCRTGARSSLSSCWHSQW